MNAFNVKLTKNTDWSNAYFTAYSVWGSGNDGRNMWGWGGTGGMTVSNPFQEDGSSAWYITVSIDHPNPDQNADLAFIARYILDNKRYVFAAIMS